MMYKEVNGKGIPVVLLHGFCEDVRIWKELLPALEVGYKVISIDLPGFGKSEVQTPDLAKWASEIALQLKKAEIDEPFHLLGHSLGGYVALALAENSPASIRSLTLLHSSAFADNEEKKKARDRQAESVKNYGVAPFVKGLIPGLFAPNYKGDELEFALNIALGQKPAGIIAALEAMKNRSDRTHVLKEAKFPVQIISGKEDQLLDLKGQAEMAEMPKSCSFSVLKKSGHMGMLEEPEELNALLNKFYQEI